MRRFTPIVWEGGPLALEEFERYLHFGTIARDSYPPGSTSASTMAGWVDSCRRCYISERAQGAAVDIGGEA